MKIEKLTKEQETKLLQFKGECLKIGYSTSDTDKELVTKSINRIYEINGYEKPKIFFCDGKLSSTVLINILKDTSLLNSLNASLNASLDASLNASLNASLDASLHPSLNASLQSSLLNSLGDSLQDSLRASLQSSLYASLHDSLQSSLGASLRDSIQSSLGASLHDSLHPSLYTSLRDSLLNSLGDSLQDSLRASLRPSLYASLRDSLQSSLYASLRASLQSSLYASLRDSLQSSLGASLRDSIYKIKPVFTYFYGNIDIYWLSPFIFAREVLGVSYGSDQNENLNIMYDLSKSCSDIFFYKNVAFVTRKPSKLLFDEFGQLHSEKEAAAEYKDGLKFYYIHGVRVSEYIVLNPELITIEKIKSEKNADVRSIMIERYGIERYIVDTNCELVHEDSIEIGGGVDGNILRALFKESGTGDQYMLSHDGSTDRTYAMSVSNEAKNCRDAHYSICGYWDEQVKVNS